MEKNFFSQSIIQTLSYFDIFEYPLTREELYHFFWFPKETLSYTDFALRLEKEIAQNLQGKVENSGGYYFLSARKEIIEKRERKINYTEKKIQKALLAAKKLRYLPCVKAMFVCNQLPVGVKQNSDIDVFIIVKNNRMWLTRLLITITLSIFRLRRTGKKITDRICLSFYVTDDALDLSSICISPPDIYQAYWSVQLIPLFDPYLIQKRIEQNNTWVKSYLPQAHFTPLIFDRSKVEEYILSRSIKRFCEWFLSGNIGNMIEKSLRYFQKKKMKFNEPKQMVAGNKNVVISDTMLKFHENDRKEYFKTEWEKRCHQFLET